jgi:hypothetical protein
MSQFILLLIENPATFSAISPEEIQAVIQEYTDWRNKLASKDRLADANKLKDEGGRQLSLQNGKFRVVDGPYAEAKEVMGGYFIIKAASYDEAVEISKDCPHLKYGGRIDLREIEVTGEE